MNGSYVDREPIDESRTADMQIDRPETAERQNTTDPYDDLQTALIVSEQGLVRRFADSNEKVKLICCRMQAV